MLHDHSTLIHYIIASLYISCACVLSNGLSDEVAIILAKEVTEKRL
jgi:hypothetical protein